MPKIGNIDEETRWQIVLFYYLGIALREIAFAFNCDERSAQRWIYRYETTGNVKDKPRSGRPRKTTRDEDIDIVAASKADHFRTAVEILKSSQFDITVWTVRNRLNENNLNACIAAQAERLNELHKINRLNFANLYMNFDGWPVTIFSDECTLITGAPHKRIVWREEGTRYQEENIQFVQNSGRAAVSVWGFVTRDCLGHLFRISGHFDKNKYLDMMQNFAMPIINDLFPDGNHHFIQDRSPHSYCNRSSRILSRVNG